MWAPASAEDAEDEDEEVLSLLSLLKPRAMADVSVTVTLPHPHVSEGIKKRTGCRRFARKNDASLEGPIVDRTELLIVGVEPATDDNDEALEAELLLLLYL